MNNLDGNLAALRQYENEQANADARDEAVQEISASFVDDIVSAIACVCKYEIGVTITDQEAEDILLNTHGEAFLNELAEFILEKKGEQYDPS
jgi:hypothetical protein